MGIKLYLNLFFTHFIVLKRRADGSNSNSSYSGWEESAEIERALRRTARSVTSEREGTGRPVIFDVVFAIFKNLFFCETETDGRKIMPQ